MNAVQMAFEAAGLDPREVAQLPLFERIDLYEALEFDPEQREVIEAAVRLIIRGAYLRGRP